jgi:Putative motility protein
MDMSLVMAAMALQAGKLQAQVSATILKSNLDAQKSDVQTLLGMGGQTGSSAAALPAGVGGSLDVTA